MLATRTAQEVLNEIEPTEDPKQMAKIRNQVGDKVSSILGNQRTMALKSYIDPEVFREHSPKGFKNWKDAEKAKKNKKAS